MSALRITLEQMIGQQILNQLALKKRALLSPYSISLLEYFTKKSIKKTPKL